MGKGVAELPLPIGLPNSISKNPTAWHDNQRMLPERVQPRPKVRSFSKAAPKFNDPTRGS